MHLQTCLERFEKHAGREAEHAMAVRALLEDGFIVCPDPDDDSTSYVFDDFVSGETLVGAVVGEPRSKVVRSEDIPW